MTPCVAAIMQSNSRESIVIGGWRAGKSTVLAFKLFECMFHGYVLAGKPGLFWLVGPDYAQTNEEFRYISEWARSFGLIEEISAPLEGSRLLRLRGNVVLETKSSQHSERLGSVAPDMIGVCEAGQISDEVRTMIIGRAAEKRASIVYAGTLEDDEGHQQWAWYQELALAWLDGAQCEKNHDCPAEHAAFSLPTWENTAVFPNGEEDLEILRLREIFDPYTFARRIAAVPTGVQFAVYPQLQTKHLLKVMSQEDLSAPILSSAGGLDYGTVHPSSLVVVQLVSDERDRDPKFVGPRGRAWVREVWFSDSDPGDATRLDRARKNLSLRWRIYRWNLDPNERYIARNYGGDATSYSTSAREARIGLVTARLNLNKLFFDLNGPGVRELYEEMQRYHRRKTKEGELKIVRMDDDRTAALEDAIEALDGKPQVIMPSNVQRSYPRERRREFARRG